LRAYIGKELRDNLRYQATVAIVAACHLRERPGGGLLHFPVIRQL
jgi:hypothetical protein